MFKSSLMTISPIILLFASCNMITCSNKQPVSANNQKAWYDTLPPCPCENPDKNGVQLNDGWAKDKGEIETYHSGATECFRSYPVILTDEGASGQQCCYDSAGHLITGGSGAGTPDKESTCAGENSKGIMIMRIAGLLGHYRKDVVPWENMGGKDSGWKKYNLLWVPSKGVNCN